MVLKHLDFFTTSVGKLPTAFLSSWSPLQAFIKLDGTRLLLRVCYVVVVPSIHHCLIVLETYMVVLAEVWPSMKIYCCFITTQVHVSAKRRVSFCRRVAVIIIIIIEAKEFCAEVEKSYIVILIFPEKSLAKIFETVSILFTFSLYISF